MLYIPEYHKPELMIEMIPTVFTNINELITNVSLFQEVKNNVATWTEEG